MILFTVHDKAADAYIKPFAMDTERDAIEGLREVAKDEKTNYHKFPEDFTLVALGTYDVRNGKIELYQEKKIIINCAKLIQ